MQMASIKTRLIVGTGVLVGVLVMASTVLSFVEARSTAATERSATLARSLRNSTAAMKAIGDAVRTYADSVSRRPDILAAVANADASELLNLVTAEFRAVS